MHIRRYIPRDGGIPDGLTNGETKSLTNGETKRQIASDGPIHWSQLALSGIIRKARQALQSRGLDRVGEQPPICLARSNHLQPTSKPIGDIMPACKETLFGNPYPS
jgi:hypothetical protein